jgi:dihydroorotate dehydrogenase
VRDVCVPRDPDLVVRTLGLRFPSPVGLAAGFDKNGHLPTAMRDLGFGFVEVGSVTARPWPGNPRPRLFRLPEERALVNRMGLGNDGAGVITARLTRGRHAVGIPVLINVAKTPDPALEGEAGVQDYLSTILRVMGVADAVVLNVSCPNTEDGRTFEDPPLLDQLLLAAREALPPGGLPPLLVKLSGDLDPGRLREVLAVTAGHRIDGLVAINTTTDRSLITRVPSGALDAIGRGGLSGAPLKALARRTVAAIRSEVGDDLPIIGVGGVENAEDARALRDAGATLVEAYTGFVYGGLHFARQVATGLGQDRSVGTPLVPGEG